MRNAVFICSRMEELSHSRRAAFEAIIDSGYSPVLYESSPQPDGSEDSQSILEAREQVDRLLSRSTHLLGLFFHTLGRPLREFAGLSAVEYEVYRFLVLERLRYSGIAPEEVNAELERLFTRDRDLDGNAPLQHEIGVIRQQLRLVQFVDEVKSLPREHLRRLQTLLFELDSKSSIAVGRPYYKIFKQRVSLMRRTLKYEIVTEPRLGDFLQDLSSSTFHAGEADAPAGKGKIYFPASDNLYGKVTKWLKDLRPRAQSVPLARRYYYRLTALDEPGQLLRVLNVLFRHDVNVEDIELGVDEGERCMKLCCEVASDEDNALPDSVILSTVEKELEELRFNPRRLDGWNDCHALPHAVDGTYQVDIRSANVPGMLFRVASLLVKFSVSVQSIRRIQSAEAGGPRKRTRRHFQVQCGLGDPEKQEELRRRLTQQLKSMVGVRYAVVRPPHSEAQILRVPRIGECLAILGHLDADQIIPALANRAKGERFGATLLRNALVTDEQLQEALARQRVMARTAGGS